MRPALAFPYHDPDLLLFPHLQTILPDLKAHFAHAYVCPPLATQKQTHIMEYLRADDFFTVFPLDIDLDVGEVFAHLYQHAADAAHPEQPIHLCYLDRMAFALEGTYRASFLRDVDTVSPADLPLIFHRSPLAWQSHPQNYRDIETMVTTVGRHLFGVELDYAWCHLVVPARQLHEIIPLVKLPNISMVAEMVYHLQADIHTREVDWLAWEDPFILGRNAAELKRERETSMEETRRRLAYALPMIEFLTKQSHSLSVHSG